MCAPRRRADAGLPREAPPPAGQRGPGTALRDGTSQREAPPSTKSLHRSEPFRGRRALSRGLVDHHTTVLVTHIYSNTHSQRAHGPSKIAQDTSHCATHGTDQGTARKPRGGLCTSNKARAAQLASTDRVITGISVAIHNSMKNNYPPGHKNVFYCSNQQFKVCKGKSQQVCLLRSYPRSANGQLLMAQHKNQFFSLTWT